jgi:non-heme chloroperoxidase
VTSKSPPSAPSNSRRKAIIAGAGAAAAASVSFAVNAATKATRQATKPQAHPNPPPHKENQLTDRIAMKDGTQIYYKDWGEGPVVVFSHGWPLDADAWDSQMLFLSERGYRVVAHDRRGHGRSSQPGRGNDMDTYADDLATVMDTLDLNKATLVGHSTGGGEVARYIGRHGTQRVAKAVLISAVPPIMLKSENNPGGLPLSVFDGIRASVAGNRSQFYRDFALPFYGYNRAGAKVSQGVIDQFWLMGMTGSVKSAYECVKAFSETDFTEDLRKIRVPALVMHGDDDQIVPITDAGMLSARIIPSATLKIYSGAPHGMCTTMEDKINADLLEFLKS